MLPFAARTLQVQTPATIGRYDVLRPLAVGGMGEILLARLRGPGRFQQHVVIKRIFPHLARDAEFRAMFLDEARIVAGLQHVNVVHVHELDAEGDDLFLVMEYLRGRNLAAVMKRLAERGERMPAALACHIASEACAGLHAAHELRDAEGRALHVVHRDVSPQNLFVTFEGDVKVIDFGVAKAADRLSRTATDQTKGKFGYMSPEQCRHEDVDRTTDVFALGIVLHEMVTGHRLFRGNELATVRAICDEPIPRPEKVYSKVPPRVSAIVMRALDRDPSERYPTMESMRADLIAAARALDPAAGRDALRAHMTRVFAGEKDPETFDDAAVALPETSASAGRRRIWPFAIALTVLLGALIAFAVNVDTDPPPPPASASDSASEAEAEAEAEAETEAEAEAETEAEAEADPETEVAFEIRSEPSGADVRIGGERRGITPLTIWLERASVPVELEVELDGHRPHRTTLAPAEGGATLDIPLRRREPRMNDGMSAGSQQSMMFFYFE